MVHVEMRNVRDNIIKTTNHRRNIDTYPMENKIVPIDASIPIPIIIFVVVVAMGLRTRAW